MCCPIFWEVEDEILESVIPHQERNGYCIIDLSIYICAKENKKVNSALKSHAQSWPEVLCALTDMVLGINTNNQPK